MLTPLEITSTLDVIPLIDIQSAVFAKGYKNGVHWRLYGWSILGEMQAQGPLRVSFLVNNLITCVQLNRFDGHHDKQLQKDVGYFIGMYHGGVLSSETGMLRSDVNVLAIFENLDAMRGYCAGREWYFCEAQPHELRYTDAKLIQRIREVALESMQFHDGERTWHYAIGCLLGELSGQLFPATPQEFQGWEAQRQKWLEVYNRHMAQECNTELLPAPVRVYTA
jgi:hypothetical protein